MMRKYLYESLKYTLRCYPVIKGHIREVERLYSMTLQELRARNEEMFLRQFARAIDKSPFYHRLYTDAGIGKSDVNSLDDIVKLPVVTKEMVRQHAREILTIPRWQVVEAHTSGTTGSPLTIFESWPSIWRSQAYTYCARRRNGFTYGQPLVSLRGNLDHRTTHLMLHASNTLYLSSYCLNQDHLAMYHDKIVRFKPVAIEGYPSSLYNLALLLKDSNLTLNIPVAFTSSETLLDHQRALIERQLGTVVYDNYGMTEQAIYLQESSDHSGYHELPGYGINEYLDDGVLCTPLINEAFPLIRYKTTDVMQLDGNNVVKRIDGRMEDSITCKDGTTVQRLDFLFKGVNHVKMSQLVHTQQGILEVRIVPDDGFTTTDQQTIEQNLINRLGPGNIDYLIKLITQQDIIYTPRGKFRYLVNLNH